MPSAFALVLYPAFWKQIKRKKGDIKQRSGVAGDTTNFMLMKLLMGLTNVAAPSLMNSPSHSHAALKTSICSSLLRSSYFFCNLPPATSGL